jgi:hypothetical protein
MISSDRGRSAGGRAARPAAGARTGAHPLGLALHPLALAALAGALALGVVLAGPAGPDAPAHLYEIAAYRARGFHVWDNLWYGGRYAEVGYSLIFAPAAAALGLAALMTASAAAAAGAFADLARRRWGRRSWPAAAAFAVLAPGSIVSAQWPFMLGTGFGMAALWALQVRRAGLAVVLLALCAAASPLALVFTLVPLAAAALTSPGWWRQRRLVLGAAGIALVVALQLAEQLAFSRPGARYPSDLSAAVTVGVLCAAGIALCGRRRDQQLMLAVFAVYAATAAVALLVPSPVGGNCVRLAIYAGAPLLLVPMAARGFRPLWALLPLLGLALWWQGSYLVATGRAAAGDPTADAAFWRPAAAFVARHGDPDHRVEVVATAGKWEAYRLPVLGVPLARGWYRQDDWPQNAPLYEPLSGAAYRRWLRDMGVRYVLLPDAHRDGSARAEALLVDRGEALPQVARLPGWTVYALPHPTPIVTPAGGARVVALDAGSLTLAVRRPGTYRLRLSYTPYWRAEGPACVAPRAPWGTILRARAPGTVVLRVAVTPARVLDALLGRRPACPT